MEYITSVTYRVDVNGQIGEVFKGGRGLKQGDPLSPLLFVLTMEYFTRLVMTACTNLNFAFQPSCKALKLNHLIFTDDVMIFCKAHPQTLSFIKDKLLDIYNCAGLQAKHAKSQIVFRGCTLPLQQQCLDITSFDEGSLPMKYLGVPITASRLSKLESRTLVEKIVGKIRV